ncbi:MAG: glycosyltransferase family 10 [Candidatus Babeliales bacterium]
MKKIWLVYFLCAQLLVYAKPVITILPFAGFEHSDVFFNPEERDGTTVPFIQLRDALIALGYVVEVSRLETINPDCQAIIALNIPSCAALRQLENHPAKKLFLIFEPPTVNPLFYDRALHRHFTYVYTMLDSLKGDRYRKLYYPQPTLLRDLQMLPFEQKKLCTLIAGNKYSPSCFELYSARLATIDFFEQHHPDQFDLYGVGWSSMLHPCYQGTVSNKMDCLRRYKFCICYENTHDLAGYLTEKIFDCLVANCVPVYWGAYNVDTYVPSSCFIDRRDFKDDAALYTFLTQMPEHEYKQYQDAAQHFLRNARAYLFSYQFFIHTIVQEICPDYSQELLFTAQEIAQLSQAIALHTRIRAELETA